MIIRLMFIGIVLMSSLFPLYIFSAESKRSKAKQHKAVLSEVCNKPVLHKKSKKIEYCVCHPNNNFIVETGEFCPHVYEAPKNAMKPAIYCWFNKERRERDETQLTSVKLSAQEKMNLTNLDDIDQIIFKKEAAPYSYQTIMKAQDINAYVLKLEYETLCNYWILALKALGGNCMECISKSNHTENAKSSSSQDINLNQQVLNRVKKYISFLEDFTQYEHHCCVGLIVSMRAVLCLKIANDC